MNEVASSVVGHPNAAMTIFACGSGNDFVKVFGGKERFQNIDALLAAKVRAIDALKIKRSLVRQHFPLWI